jgi:hypothetical protein
MLLFLGTAQEYLQMSGNELRLIQEFDAAMEKIFKVRSLIVKQKAKYRVIKNDCRDFNNLSYTIDLR